jgi:hypothetical protein
LTGAYPRSVLRSSVPSFRISKSLACPREARQPPPFSLRIPLPYLHLARARTTDSLSPKHESLSLSKNRLSLSLQNRLLSLQKPTLSLQSLSFTRPPTLARDLPSSHHPVALWCYEKRYLVKYAVKEYKALRSLASLTKGGWLLRARAPGHRQNTTPRWAKTALAQSMSRTHAAAPADAAGTRRRGHRLRRRRGRDGGGASVCVCMSECV